MAISGALDRPMPNLLQNRISLREAPNSTDREAASMNIRQMLNELGILEPYHGFSTENHPLDLEGWASDHHYFPTLISMVRPSQIIEIGAWNGASAINIARHALALRPDVTVLCIDPFLASNEVLWRDPQMRALFELQNSYPTVYHQFLANIIRERMTETIFPLPMTPISAAELLTKFEVQADLIYVDGGHSEYEVYGDLVHYWSILRPGGILFGDDYLTERIGVIRAVDRFVHEQSLPLETDTGKWFVVKPEVDDSEIVIWSDTQDELKVNDLESRERLLRSQFNLPAESSGLLSVIYQCGDFTISDEARLVKHSFDQALNNESYLPPEIRDIDGMSGQKYRTFINNLVRSCLSPRYLEVGSWTGSTATAALSGNCASALCIDNWSEYGGPKDRFFQNMKNVLSKKIQFKFMECDFRSVDYGSIGKFNIYLFDGPHEEVDQYDGIVMVQPALTDTFFLIVDDWNWRAVRVGTLRALAATGCHLEYCIEVRTTLDGSHAFHWGKRSDWHNGYFIAVVRKAC